MENLFTFLLRVCMRESPSVTLFLSWLTMVTIKTSRLEVSKNAWRLRVISWDVSVDKNVTCEVMKNILRTSWKLWKCYSDSFNIRNTEKLTWLLLYARLPLLLILGVPPEVVQTAPGRPHLKGVSAVSKKNKNLLIRALNPDCFRRG